MRAAIARRSCGRCRNEDATGWLALNDEDFAAEAEAAMGGFLGKVAMLAPRSSFPLGFHHAAQITAQRLALVGDSAHAIHPIAGQGLNLGFRDVAALAQVLVEGARLGLDLGDQQLLDRYQRWRSFDALSVAFATDTLTRIYGVPGKTASAVRRFGMGLVGRIGAAPEQADERSARHQRRPSAAAQGIADLTGARRFPRAATLLNPRLHARRQHATAQPSATPHLYLVDGSSYIFRAYHRLPPLTNRHGQPAGAVYGYTTMLWKLAGDLSQADGPTHMAVILDASEHTHRNEMYDQYKAHRPPPPEDLVPQFPLIRVATRAFSIPCIEEEGLEADDIIACYVTAAIKAGWKVTIVSSDKDLMQLIDEDAGIDMLDTMNDRRIGRNEVLEKFGVPPEKVGDVLALMGDSVDNVPGVPGIGPKTASQLIQQFGDLETVLASTDQITKPKLKQKLIDHADDARLIARAGAAGVRFAAARAARSAGAEGHSRRAAARIPRGPGVQVAARPADERRQRAAPPGGAAAAAASMTSWRQWSRRAAARRAREDRGRPLEI